MFEKSKLLKYNAVISILQALERIQVLSYLRTHNTVLGTEVEEVAEREKVEKDNTRPWG